MRLAILAALSLLPAAASAYVPDTATLGQVPRLALAAAPVSAAVEAVKHEALRYAVTQPLTADARNGLWDAPAPGLARWRLRIASAGAQSLSLRLHRLQLPQGAELYLYAASGADVQGPLRAAGDGSLLTPLVRGDEAVLEARMPAAAQNGFALALTEVFHGYRSLLDAARPKGFFGDSGACEINTACADGDAWRAQIRATLLLTIGNVTLCSGSLVNNTAEDDRPLVLTANHCGVTSGNVGNTIAYFNVQKSSCDATADGPVNQNIRGGTWLAADSAADFTLFELSAPPPPAFAAYHAGWNARADATPQSGVVIHHPSGDDKKISTYTSAATRQDDVCIGGLPIGCVGGFSVDAWSVTWARGATEGGSSGSGLYDQDRRLVGVLSGGNSDCAGNQNNGGVDFFGRLDAGWTAGSARSAQLKAHLDPTGSGCLALDGRDAGAPASGACGSTTGGGTGGGGGGGGAMNLGLLVLLVALSGRRAISRRACRA